MSARLTVTGRGRWVVATAALAFVAAFAVTLALRSTDAAPRATQPPVVPAAPTDGAQPRLARLRSVAPLPTSLRARPVPTPVPAAVVVAPTPQVTAPAVAEPTPAPPAPTPSASPPAAPAPAPTAAPQPEPEPSFDSLGSFDSSG